jgi:DNA-binding transcriptional MerR regulator/DNA-directed RNA polymerase subunit RPC12/RpoP
MEVKSMSTYTTGELAKLCDISVRTVQFYDARDLLKPTELTEGGRRLYSDDDLKKLSLICLLKSLGLSLDSIQGILNSENPNKVLLLLLDEQEKHINAGIREKQNQKQAIGIVRDNIRNMDRISVNSIHDIERIMQDKIKLQKVHRATIFAAIVVGIIEWGTLIYGIIKGFWTPFFIGLPIAVALGLLVVILYRRHTAYICPECNTRFRPTSKNWVGGIHTPKIRKLKCTNCGYIGYCVEVYDDKTENKI